MYSLDYKKRVVEYRLENHTTKETSEVFKIGTTTVNKWVKDNIYDIADEYGFKVIFLPPYSPDLNPIEKFWANLKIFLRSFSHLFKTIQGAFMNFFQTA